MRQSRCRARCPHRRRRRPADAATPSEASRRCAQQAPRGSSPRVAMRREAAGRAMRREAAGRRDRRRRWRTRRRRCAAPSTTSPRASPRLTRVAAAAAASSARPPQTALATAHVAAERVSSALRTMEAAAQRASRGAKAAPTMAASHAPRPGRLRHRETAPAASSAVETPCTHGAVATLPPAAAPPEVAAAAAAPPAVAAASEMQHGRHEAGYSAAATAMAPRRTWRPGP